MEVRLNKADFLSDRNGTERSRGGRGLVAGLAAETPHHTINKIGSHARAYFVLSCSSSQIRERSQYQGG